MEHQHFWECNVMYGDQQERPLNATETETDTPGIDAFPMDFW